MPKIRMNTKRLKRFKQRLDDDIASRKRLPPKRGVSLSDRKSFVLSKARMFLGSGNKMCLENISFNDLMRYRNSLSEKEFNSIEAALKELQKTRNSLEAQKKRKGFLRRGPYNRV